MKNSVSVYKTCTKCGVSKNRDNFYRCKSSDGHRTMCKHCFKVVTQKWREDNREESRNHSRKYRENNLEKEIKRQRRWKKKNTDVNRKLNREWRSKNPHKNAYHASIRRARQADATPSWLTVDHMKEIEYLYWLIRDLYTTTGEKYHVDHIVPLKGENICGLHVPWNLQVLPSDLNQRKYNKF